MKICRKNNLIYLSSLITIYSTFFFSCNSKNGYYSVDTIKIVDKPYCGVSIKGDTLSSSFIEPQQMLSVDSILIVLTGYNKHIVNILDCATDSIICSFGEIGHAQNEFTNYPQNMYLKNDTRTGDRLLYISDNNTITHILNIEKSINERICHIDSVIKHVISDNGEKTIYCLNDSNMLCYYGITYEDPRDKIFYPPYWVEMRQNESLECHPYPHVISTPSYGVMRAAYETKSRISPNTGYLVSMMRFVDFICLYNIETKKTIGITTTDTYDFSLFDKEEDVNKVVNQIQIFNIDVAATDDYIYLLKTKSSFKELVQREEEGIYDFPSYLHIYNWDGELRNIYQLDPGTINICYNKSLETLYCINAYGHLIKYNLSKQ